MQKYSEALKHAEDKYLEILLNKYIKVKKPNDK